jgi:uncharacterized protein YggE
MRKSLILFLSAILTIFVFASRTPAQQRSVSGRLAPTVEAGGWLIVGENEKYLLLNAGKYRRERWFGNGVEVAATGEIKPGAVTIYQEGVPFEARTLRPIENSANVNQFTTVTVTGDARVTAQPDTAIVSASVVTQNRRAVEAQQQNAAQTTAVINALKRAAGSGAEIKTSGYALVPQRVYKENQPPTITGYEARNSISVTLSDLTKVGAAIDAATEAGANNIDGVSFTLRNDRAARGRALAEATREAIGKANTLAQALGGRVVRILSVHEGGTNPPRPLAYAQPEALASRVADTPIEVGTLEINSQVQLTAEIEIGANPR